jgi:hypothetical protein
MGVLIRLERDPRSEVHEQGIDLARASKSGFPSLEDAVRLHTLTSKRKASEADQLRQAARTDRFMRLTCAT